jgi:hypothetical protein
MAAVFVSGNETGTYLLPEISLHFIPLQEEAVR